MVTQSFHEYVLLSSFANAIMLLSLLLIFCKILSENSSFKDAGVTNEAFSSVGNVHFKNIISKTDTKSEHNERLDLVPLEFPVDFYEREGDEVFKTVKKKMDDFFGESMVDEAMKFDSSDGVLDYMSKADFHNSWMNTIVNTIGENLKSKETSLDNIGSSKECRKSCRKNHRNVNNYLQQSFESIVSGMIKEDIRFAISQDPTKSYSYTLNPETKKYDCKCLDEGYSVKVSPKLKELIEKKFFQNDGKSLAEKIAEVDSNTDISSIGDIISWRKAGQLAMYLVGWKSKAKRSDDFVDFVVWQGFILIFLFIFCHCVFYFYLIYVIYLFITDYVF